MNGRCQFNPLSEYTIHIHDFWSSCDFFFFSISNIHLKSSLDVSCESHIWPPHFCTSAFLNTVYCTFNFHGYCVHLFCWGQCQNISAETSIQTRALVQATLLVYTCHWQASIPIVMFTSQPFLMWYNIATSTCGQWSPRAVPIVQCYDVISAVLHYK